MGDSLVDPRDQVTAYTDGVRQAVLEWLRSDAGKAVLDAAMVEGIRLAVTHDLATRTAILEKRRIAETTGGGLLAKP